MNAHPVSHKNRTPDKRYTITREWCGDSAQHYVARFCGEWIGSSRFYASAVTLAVGHNSKRQGALVITEQR